MLQNKRFRTLPGYHFDEEEKEDAAIAFISGSGSSFSLGLTRIFNINL